MSTRGSNKKQNWPNEFIVSAFPWLTSSTASAIKEHTFTDSRVSSDPGWVTSFVAVTNTGASGSLTIGMTQLGFNTFNTVIIPAGSTLSLPISIKSIFVSGAAAQPYSIMAGITNIRADTMSTITSSNHFPGVG